MYKNRRECVLLLYGCYPCVLNTRGFLWPHVSGINLSPAHSAFKFTDLYYPVIPSHSCQGLKNFEHWRWLHPAATRDWRGFLNHWNVLLWIMVTCRNRKCIPSFRHWCLKLGCPCLHVRAGNSVDTYLSISQYTLYPLPHPRQTLWKHFTIMAAWIFLMRW